MNARNPNDLTGNVLEMVIRVGLVIGLVLWCFDIIKPFIGMIIWGVIIAVAVNPVFEPFQRRLGDRKGLAVTLFTLLMLALLITPVMLLAETVVQGAIQLGTALRDDTFRIPTPPASVAGWPLVGEKIDAFWRLASENLEEALDQLEPQIRAVSRWLLTAAASAGLGVLKFVAAIIIAGVLMGNAVSGQRAAHMLFTRLIGERGEEIAELTESTVRSVATGILGVALIQSLLAGLGFLVAGIPGAGLLAVFCLFLAIIQVGPFLILVGTVIYVFQTAATMTAVLFTIWCVFVGTIDNILKPILLGRGVKVPMLVIFLGAIGGFISMGIIGLFVGSIVLVLGYTLFMAWMSVKVPGVELSRLEDKG
ncbi:MAG: AI-2E family transporter [Gammaproteobacteria bacterium]